MKIKNSFLFGCACCFCITKALPQAGTNARPFITTWNTSAYGVSQNNQVIFGTDGKNFAISWINMNDAADTGSRTASAGDTITFAKAGTYKVYITPGNGTFSAIKLYTNYDIYVGDIGDNYKLLSIEQWGDIQWATFESAFAGCPNLALNAIDTPNLDSVTNLSGMFDRCTSFTGNAVMNSWNTSHIRDMSLMFSSALLFNQPLSNWDVSNVTDMNGMFTGASAFNQPIGNWNVGNVTVMAAMFYAATAFNQPIGNWDVSKVTNMSQMFEDASSFNQPIGNWNVGNVTNMENMFRRFGGKKYVFNQALGNWNVGNVTNMGGMFAGAKFFNKPVNNWNVSNVTIMADMFAGAYAFNQPLDNWDVSHVTVMDHMFENATSFNQYIGNWNTGNVNYINYMFEGAKLFNQDISKWNTAKVINMYETFKNASAFNQNLGAWQLGALQYMRNMLDSSGMSCSNYSQTLKGWARGNTAPNGLVFGAAGLTYDIAFAENARDTLTNIKGWTIIGDWGGHCSVVLPVGFISFTATLQGSAAILNWYVGDDINARGYNIEKSVNGNTYTSIGFVAAKTKQAGYTYTDNNLEPGTSYYRIKEIGNDDRYLYSVIRKIGYSTFTWKVNGNPVNNSSVALTLDKPADISIQVVSSTGKLIKTIRKGKLVAGNYTIPLVIDNLSGGLYFIRLMVDDKYYVASVVK